MSLDLMLTIEAIESLENYIFRIRPNEELRDKIDIAYKIENQSVIIYEIRPHYIKSEIKIESKIAKTTFVKAKNYWKLFWFKSDLKWHIYKPHSTVKDIKEFVTLVEEDKYGCFWG